MHEDKLHQQQKQIALKIASAEKRRTACRVNGLKLFTAVY
jgi:hypothetical protein